MKTSSQSVTARYSSWVLLVPLLIALLSPPNLRSNEDADEAQARKLESQGQMKAAPSLKTKDGSTTIGFSLQIKIGTGSETATAWRYTLDGKTPRYSSKKPPSSGIQLTSEGTFLVKVAGFHTGTQKRITKVASGTFTLSTPVLDPPSARPGGGRIWKSTKVAIDSPRSSYDSIVRYTLDGTEPNERSPAVPYWSPILWIEKTATLRLRAFGTGKYIAKTSATATYQFNRENRIVLFLHGINSSASKWAGTARALAGNPITIPEIYSGTLVGTKWAEPDEFKGICYYLVKFGSKDKAGSTLRSGLEGAAEAIRADSGASGDFSTLREVGNEVEQAIQLISLHHKNTDGGATKFALVGHSRGGLAGRALLQYYPNSEAATKVVALATIGTPHQGSALGRIYQYLKANPRPAASNANPNPASVNDWQIIDFLKSSIDARRPVTDDLAIGSAAMYDINSRTLPSHIRYGAAVFDGVSFGVLKNFAGYSIYDLFGGIPGIVSPLSQRGSDSLLEGQSRESYRGDGIVSAAFQSMAGLGVSPERFNNTAGISHTNEPEQTADILALLRRLVTWWDE